MRILRMYVRRIALCVVGGMATIGILLTQVAVSPNSDGTHDVNNGPLNGPHLLDTPRGGGIVSDSEHEFQSNDKAPFLESNGQRKLQVKVPSHEELPPHYLSKKNLANDYDDNVDSGAKIDAKSDGDGLFNKYLGTRRKPKDPDIVSLSRLPLHLFPLNAECPNASTLGTFWYQKHSTFDVKGGIYVFRRNLPREDSWDRFYAQIGTCDLYRNKSDIVEELLHDISIMPIKHVTNLDSGTQVKFIITFENDKKILFKPMRFGRSFETHPDQFYFTDFERHVAEIAAFHLDRLLGFRRAVPTVGRVVNISSELLANADKALARTFFYSPVKNLCFVGKCDYYCDTTHAVCGHPDMVEGSFQVFLPDEEEVPREHSRSPYKRTYSKRTQEAVWQKDPSYCDWKVKYSPPFSRGRTLLDLIDLYILDFLMYNQDRHHYETISVFEYPIYFLHLDNGRAFGKTKEDDIDILAPLMQCCLIRPSTLRTLLNFYVGPVGLSEALKASLSKDPVAPVLAEKHYPALERRLEIVLKEVHKCIQKAGGDYKKVLATGFYNPDAPLAIHESEEEDE